VEKSPPNHLSKRVPRRTEHQLARIHSEVDRFEEFRISPPKFYEEKHGSRAGYAGFFSPSVFSISACTIILTTSGMV